MANSAAGSDHQYGARPEEEPNVPWRFCKLYEGWVCRMIVFAEFVASSPETIAASLFSASSYGYSLCSTFIWRIS
jgi:hypothetical protein